MPKSPKADVSEFVSGAEFKVQQVNLFDVHEFGEDDISEGEEDDDDIIDCSQYKNDFKESTFVKNQPKELSTKIIVQDKESENIRFSQKKTLPLYKNKNEIDAEIVEESVKISLSQEQTIVSSESENELSSSSSENEEGLDEVREKIEPQSNITSISEPITAQQKTFANINKKKSQPFFEKKRIEIQKSTTQQLSSVLQELQGEIKKPVRQQNVRLNFSAHYAKLFLKKKPFSTSAVESIAKENQWDQLGSSSMLHHISSESDMSSLNDRAEFAQTRQEGGPSPASQLK